MNGRRRIAEDVGTLSARVMNLVGRRIVTGHYKAGAALPPELTLCEQFGLSRTPLREAMKRLHAKGLIAVGPKSGTRVLPTDRWNQLDADVLLWRFEAGADEAILDQLYELRIAFEPEACRLAALNGSADDLQAISMAFERIVELQLDPYGVVEPDIAFHRAILMATRNMFIISIGSAISTALRFQFRLGAVREMFPPRELQQHRLIRDYILARDGNRAMACMRELIGVSRETVGEVLRTGKKQPSRPKGRAAKARRQDTKHSRTEA